MPRAHYITTRCRRRPYTLLTTTNFIRCCHHFYLMLTRDFDYLHALMPSFEGFLAAIQPYICHAAHRQYHLSTQFLSTHYFTTYYYDERFRRFHSLPMRTAIFYHARFIMESRPPLYRHFLRYWAAE